MTTATLKLYSTTVGKKAVMAVTGIVMFGFVAGHLLGNLQVFAGPAKINAYAAFLKATPGLIWPTRIVLGACALLHIFTGLQLMLTSWASRPVGYARYSSIEAGYASRTMRWSGLLILVYIIYHLLDLTFGAVHPLFLPDDVYRNLIIGFSLPQIAVPYMLAMIILGFHLRHGLWSLFQTLGLNSPRYDGTLRRGALAVAAAIAAGYLAIPLAVLSGIIS